MNLKRSTFRVAVATLLVATAACQTKSVSESPTTSAGATTNSTNTAEMPKSWPNQMQQLTYHLSVMMPMISDVKSYNDPKQKSTITTQLKSIHKIAKEINSNTKTPDQDPSLGLIGKRFEENLKLALDSFESGHTEFSRSVFKNSMAQCVQCHTRLEVGPALAQPHFISNLGQVGVVERVQFLIASRYFSEAMKEINSAIEKGDTLSIVAWQKLVQMGLIINVRFHHDVKQSQEFIAHLSTNPHIPFFIKRNLPFWEQSLKEWGRLPTPSATLKNAQKIVQKAESAQRNSRSDGGTVDYLRAGSLLHQFLAKSQVNSDKAEALYQLGLIYENVGEVGAWSMNEDYYELCIRSQPHSEMAKKCFARFQESTVSGFSGTGGLYIPDEVQKKMNELRAIAL